MEIKRRIGIAKDTFVKMDKILKDRKLHRNQNQSPELLCALCSHVWQRMLDNFTSNGKKVRSTELWFYRRMLRIPWTDRVTNVDVLTRVARERTLLRTIQKRQLQFLGHIMWKEGLENHTLTGKIEGRRGRGRHRLTYMQQSEQMDTDTCVGNAVRATKNRKKWNSMTADVLKGHGT